PPAIVNDAGATGADAETTQGVDPQSDVLPAEPSAYSNGSHVADAAPAVLTQSLLPATNGALTPTASDEAAAQERANDGAVAPVNAPVEPAIAAEPVEARAPVRPTTRRSPMVLRLLAGLSADAGSAVLLCGL